MHSYGIVVASVWALASVSSLAALAQVWLNRKLPQRAWWRALLLVLGLGLLTLYQAAGATELREIGWAEACLLLGTICLTAGLAVREASIRDAIRERELVKERLASQERLLRTTFDALPHVMAVKDSDARLLMVNRAFCELTGADPDNIQGIRVADVPTIAAEDAAPVEPEDLRILSGAEEIVETQRQHATLDGGVRDYHVVKVPLRDDAGRLDGIVVVGLDVTERNVAQRALADNQRLLREVFDAIPHFLTVKDRAGRYLMLNQSYTDTFGVTQDHALKRTPVEMTERPREEMRQVAADDDEVLSGRTGRYTAERWRLGRGGERLLMEIIKAPLHDAKGDLIGVVSLGIDITERRRIEDELADYRSTLEERVAERSRELEAAQQELLTSERLATIGRLTATVSHELRNPLGTISASFHTVRRLLEEPGPEVDRRMDRIERNIVRCVKIVEDLLDYARLPEIKREPTDIDAWLHELVQELEVPSRVALELKLRSAARVSIDPERMRQAVVNLIQNASQSILEAESDGNAPGAATVEITSSVTDGRLEIGVRDSGPGIRGEVLGKVFEPLYSTRSFGIGLGLPLVKQIAEGHAGGVELTSEAGEGTLVTLWVPATGGA